MTSNTQIHILNITVNIDKHIDIQYQLDVANKEAIEPRVLLEVITSKALRSPP
jgi:hypothetical protein